MPLLVFKLHHQNLLIRFSNYLQSNTGNLKHCTTYIGSACKIDLIKTSLPPKDKLQILQFFDFWLTLSFSSRNTTFFLLPTIVGKPIYFSRLFEIRTPKTPPICSLRTSWHFTEVNQWILEIHQLSKNTFVFINYWFHWSCAFHCCFPK